MLQPANRADRHPAIVNIFAEFILISLCWLFPSKEGDHTAPIQSLPRSSWREQSATQEREAPCGGNRADRQFRDRLSRADLNATALRLACRAASMLPGLDQIGEYRGLAERPTGFKPGTTLHKHPEA